MNNQGFFILDKFKELPEQLGGMRDAGESSESEKGWNSEDDSNESPGGVATRGRHVPPMQQSQPPRSAGRGTAAVRPVQNNPSPAPMGPTDQPESEPSMTCSEPTTNDPLEEEEDPWAGGQDPWSHGRDPWSGGGTGGSQADRVRVRNANSEVAPDAQDRWAKPNPGARAQQDGDPWEQGHDPWSRARGPKGSQPNGKGTPAPASTRQEEFAKGWQQGKSTEDPWLQNDPWAEAAGKGQGRNGTPETGKGAAPKPKPAPPKPPSSDGEDPQSTWSRAASGVGTARVQRGIGPDGEKKVDYLDYAKRRAGSKTSLHVFSKSCVIWPMQKHSCQHVKNRRANNSLQKKNWAIEIA